jgi:ankyrin repeat protein
MAWSACSRLDHVWIDLLGPFPRSGRVAGSPGRGNARTRAEPLDQRHEKNKLNSSIFVGAGRHGTLFCHDAARDGDEAKLRLLSHAELSAADQEGLTPAHYAAENGHEGCLRVLHELVSSHRQEIIDL